MLARTPHFFVDLPFPPQSKSNFRRGRTWAPQRGFEHDVATLTRATIPDGWNRGDPSVPLKLRPAVVVAIVATSTLDTANLSKSILDALEGSAYVNDAQVRAVAATSSRSRSDQRATVGVAQLPGDATLEELSRVQASLLDETVARFANTAPPPR